MMVVLSSALNSLKGSTGPGEPKSPYARPGMMEDHAKNNTKNWYSSVYTLDSSMDGKTHHSMPGGDGVDRLPRQP